MTYDESKRIVLSRGARFIAAALASLAASSACGASEDERPVCLSACGFGGAGGAGASPDGGTVGSGGTPSDASNDRD
jgi:hypothetical protein